MTVPILNTRQMQRLRVLVNENPARALYRKDEGLRATSIIQNKDYDGYFRVEIQENGISVRDGADESAEIAGHAYYNLIRVPCAKVDSIAAAAGYLCLRIQKNAGSHNVDYVIESSIPNQKIMASADDSTASEYPLAHISGSSAEGWTVRQISRYEIPHIFCFGPCPEESES